MNIGHFFAMGGYAAFVWSAWGITVSVFAVNIFLSVHERNQVKKILQRASRQSS